MIKELFISLNEIETLRGKLSRGAAASFFISVINTGFAFALSVLLAKVLGTDGFGSYSFVLALLTLFVIPTQLGLPVLILRETARNYAAERLGDLCGLWKWSRYVLFAMSVLAVVSIFVYLNIYEEIIGNERKGLLLIGAFFIPLAVFLQYVGSILTGLRHVVLGQIPNSIIRPILFSALIVIYWTLHEKAQISAREVLTINIFSIAFALLTSIWIFLKKVPRKLRTHPPTYQYRKWVRSLIPLTIIGGLQTILQNTDLVMIGAITNNNNVAIYKVATQWALLVVFGLQVVITAFTPFFAHALERNDNIAVLRIYKFSVLFSLTLSIFPYLLIFGFGKNLLSFFYGSDFSNAYVPLLILAAGQLTNVLTGPVAVFLNMAGKEKFTFIGLFCAAVANVTLNFALIPIYGVIGAAIATALSVTIWNIILFTFFYTIIIRPRRKSEHL